MYVPVVSARLARPDMFENNGKTELGYHVMTDGLCSVAMKKKQESIQIVPRISSNENAFDLDRPPYAHSGDEKKMRK